MHNDFTADLFANKCEDPYRSVRYDQTEMDVLRQYIEDKIERLGMTVTAWNVRERMNAASKLKPSKHDGHYGLSSNNVIIASRRVVYSYCFVIVRSSRTDDPGLSFSTLLLGLPGGNTENAKIKN